MILYGGNSDSEFKLENCMFKNCSSTYRTDTDIDVGGGAIYIYSCELTINNCSFINCISSETDHLFDGGF
jgi:hypothetical protein